jgi:NAD-dependent SIR2 family protein deacetylase
MGSAKYLQFIENLKENKYQNIVVLTGAGISVSAGIPDFRSPHSGIYSNL